MNDVRDLEPVLEAILFVANEPVSRDRLLEVFDPGARDAASQALDAVIERYQEAPTRGVLIDEAAGGIRFVTRPDLHGYLRRFYELSGNTRLSMPALETLAIIAYRQPVTAPEIQELRGVGSSGVLKTLLERRLVRIAGRKEVVGKPFLYATTREFLMRFGLGSPKDLPPLEQFEEMVGGEVGGDDDAETGHDHEEDVLRQAALIEDSEADEPDEPDEAALDDEAPSAAESAPDETGDVQDVAADSAASDRTAPDRAASDNAESDDPASDGSESDEWDEPERADQEDGERVPAGVSS